LRIDKGIGTENKNHGQKEQHDTLLHLVPPLVKKHSKILNNTLP
jgi:hypothetical protein